MFQVQVRGVAGDGVLGAADPAGEEGHGAELLLPPRTTKGQSMTNEFHNGNKLHFGELSHFSTYYIVTDINCLIFQVMAVDLTQSGEEFGSEISITRGPNFETAVL